MTKKKELMGQLTNAKNNYILGLAAMSLFSESISIEHLRNSHASFGEYTVKFDQVSSLLASDADREIAIKEFLTMLIRALLKESFELVRDYAKVSKQDTMLSAQPWYQFARIIRNCISHNFHFRLTPYDKEKLPVTWNSRIIDSPLQDKPLAISFLGYDGTWELFKEMEQFALGSLK